mmetsp:Transcript_26325/g.40526  ORF Transcript_26325/g.40526 Transcript_26325/m.40526 type:complete len:187 (+) Transcript_26325:113-673(+)
MMSMASHRLMAASARNAARQLASTATRSSTTVASTAPRSQFRNPNFVLGIGSGLVLAGLHSATGSANDFYDYRFKSPKDADDLASFYGGEELMELYCVFPIVGQIMMRSATFDDTGGIKTQGFPGTMEVNMVFSDDVNEDTGETDWCKLCTFLLVSCDASTIYLYFFISTCCMRCIYHVSLFLHCS